MGSLDLTPTAGLLYRIIAPTSGQVSLAATIAGDFVFAAGQVANDVVTSAVGASIVVVSTLANIYLTFKRKQSDIDISSKVRYREEMRVQKEKDLRVLGKIKETADLRKEIADLMDENKMLRRKLEERPNAKNDPPRS